LDNAPLLCGAVGAVEVADANKHLVGKIAQRKLPLARTPGKLPTSEAHIRTQRGAKINLQKPLRILQIHGARVVELHERLGQAALVVVGFAQHGVIANRVDPTLGHPKFDRTGKLAAEHPFGVAVVAPVELLDAVEVKLVGGRIVKRQRLAERRRGRR
jgi:hypothetical protein